MKSVKQSTAVTILKQAMAGLPRRTLRGRRSRSVAAQPLESQLPDDESDDASDSAYSTTDVISREDRVPQTGSAGYFASETET